MKFFEGFKPGQLKKHYLGGVRNHETPFDIIVPRITFSERPYSGVGKTRNEYELRIPGTGYKAYIQIEPDDLNLFHIKELDEFLKGTGWGTACYYAACEEFGYISSSFKTSSESARRVWQKISSSPNHFCAVNEQRVVCISKNYDFNQDDNLLRFLYDNETFCDDDLKIQIQSKKSAYPNSSVLSQ